MPHPSNKKALRAIGLAIVTAAGLGAGWATSSNASPEDEIARLNRVRESLFEELVKARKEAAAARAELEAVIKARDQAEAEFTRLKQETGGAKPTTLPPDRPANIQPQKKAAPSPSESTASILQPDQRKMARPPDQKTAVPTQSAVKVTAQRPVARSPSPKDAAAPQMAAKDQGWTGEMGGYGKADGALSNNGPGIW